MIIKAFFTLGACVLAGLAVAGVRQSNARRRLDPTSRLEILFI
jgi:hypothetical protein